MVVVVIVAWLVVATVESVSDVRILERALRSRLGKTEQRQRGHFTLRRSHWSMQSTWKLCAQGSPRTCTHCSEFGFQSRSEINNLSVQLALDAQQGSVCSSEIWVIADVLHVL